MSDYAELRAALDAGPTPGPWAWDDDSRIATVASVSQYRIGPDYQTSGQVTYKFHADCSVDAAYIAACSPDTIRALLAERDALREFVEAKMHHLPIEDQYVASVLVDALAQEQGGSDAQRNPD